MHSPLSAASNEMPLSKALQDNNCLSFRFKVLFSSSHKKRNLPLIILFKSWKTTSTALSTASAGYFNYCKHKSFFISFRLSFFLFFLPIFFSFSIHIASHILSITRHQEGEIGSFCQDIILRNTQTSSHSCSAQSDNTVKEQQSVATLWHLPDLSSCKYVPVKSNAAEKALACSSNIR